MWSLFFIVIIVIAFAVIIIFNYRDVWLNTSEQFLKGKADIVLKFSCPDGDFWIKSPAVVKLWNFIKKRKLSQMLGRKFPKI